MKSIFKYQYTFTAVLMWLISAMGCKIPQQQLKEVSPMLPEQFAFEHSAFSETPLTPRKEFFKDTLLSQLIDTALQHNQELNIILQEIEMSKNDVLEKKGDYQPFVDFGIGTGAEKPSRFTRAGAVEDNLEIVEGRKFPEPLGDFQLGVAASWEIDIWRQLRNARDAAQLRYLAANEAKNFIVTRLIAEIAESYYELMALDNLLLTIDKNIAIQKEALMKMQYLKENAKANQLTVNRFEAQLINTQNQAFALRQRLIETENRLNALMGRSSQTISRNSGDFLNIRIPFTEIGVPSKLLENRPDIRQATLRLKAAGIDVNVARANFFPKLNVRAGIGFQAFEPRFLVNPEAILFNTAGDLLLPLINRKAIQAEYNRASARQIQSVYEYQQTVLMAYTDVINQVNKVNNLDRSVQTKTREVNILRNSVDIANNLFQFAKADYVEVLLTQEEVLQAEMELIETHYNLLKSGIYLYRALGGGWQ